MGAVIIDYAVCLGCSDSTPERQCCIVLPHRSPLGIFEYPQCLPTDEWPAMFLCLRHGHTCGREANSVRLEAEALVPGQPVPALWQIQCQCARERCGRWHKLYTAKMPDWRSIVRWILKTNPPVPCDLHTLVWREDLIHGESFAHKSPVR